MKIILRLLLALNFALLCFGFYIKNTNQQRGDFYVGLGVVMLAFVLLPFFLYTRYKNKKLSDYMFPQDDPVRDNKKE